MLFLLVSCQNAFEDSLGFDFVVNLAAETRFGQSDEVYKEGIHKLSLNCAKEAAKRGVKKYIEISSGQFESNGKEALTETNKVEPWTTLAKYKSYIESELSQIENLNYVILRPALVYGTGDRSGITPRLVIGAVYKHLEELMKLLWSKELKMNTVHVMDVCSAIWFTCLLNNRNGEIFNVVDKGNTTQGLLSDIISDIFGINHDYWGNTMSTIAIKTNGLEALVEEINEKHMSPWLDVCAKYNINNTPLNPFLYPEMLQNKNLFLNGNKLESLGFSYKIPQITKKELIEIIDDYIQMRLFPNILNK